jgi:hypothetical protein
MRNGLVALVSFLVLSGNPARGKILNDSIPAGKNFEKAVFRLWYPDDKKVLRTIVVLVPGSNGDGRSMATDTVWQEFARRNGLALLGCYFTDSNHPDPAIEYYANAREGSGQALIDVINRFALHSDHAELAALPLLLWGHSAGGQFNYEFTCWKPDRVMGFVVNKGGIYYTAIAPAVVRQVPGIFFTGEKDIEFRSDIVKGIFAVNRRFGALWTIADEPGAGHEVGSTMKLAMAFFEEILPLRLATASVESGKAAVMHGLLEESGFIGDPKTMSVVPFTQWVKTGYPTAWLPTARFSEKWKLFVEGKSF